MLKKDEVLVVLQKIPKEGLVILVKKIQNNQPNDWIAESQKVEEAENVGENRFRDKAITARRGLGDCSENLPKDQNPQQVSPKLNRARQTGSTRSKKRR